MGLEGELADAKQKSLNCCCDGTQEKLYFALGKIALGSKQEGLQNLQEILATTTYSVKIKAIRTGVLESADIQQFSIE